MVLELEKQEKKEVNVAAKSTSGHYVKSYENIVCLDEVKEAYFVEGESVLTTKNHTTLKMKKDCLIMPQNVYNPFTKRFERSRD